MAIKNIFRNLTKKVFGGGRKPMKKAKRAKPKSRKPKAKRAKPRKAAKKKTIKKAAMKTTRKAAPKARAMKAKKPVPMPVIKAKVAKVKLKKGPHKVYLALGSNVGDREEYIEQAIFLLSKTPGIKVIKKSTNYETEAETAGGDQPQFLNAAVEIQTIFDPYKLLSVVQETENALGREREVEWGPRTIDLDILLYDDQLISDEKLQIPHPLLHERLFVLKPLSEIAPKAMHPALEKTIEAIYDERKSDVGEKYDDELPGFKEIKKGTPDDFERW